MEYILIPKWVTHEEIKHSTFLPHFLKRVKIEEDKVDLNYLRNNYREDKVACQKLIDEMALRGFSFVCKKSNNILPKGSINEDAIFIRSDMNGEKYKGIDFEGIGVADFVSRFSIKNDMFFNNIPIEGFLYLNKNINIDKLINEFEINGFAFSNKLENNIEIA